MNLFTKIFGTRPPSTVPAQTVYLRPGESMPLRTAIEIVSTTIDSEFVALSMSHYSGYVREAAIGRAVELGSSTFLASIVDRLNDWVPEVRNAAKRALLTLLATVPAECFVSILPRLRSLMSATRTDHRSWLFDFEQRLVQAGGTEAIVQAITGTDFHLRRAAYFVAIDHRLLSGSEIVKRGLLSGDIVLAKRAVALLDHLPIHERGPSVAIAAASPFGPVRYAAFKLTVADTLNPDNEPFVWRTLFDSQGGLRSAAARLLTANGRDVAGRCSALLDAEALTVAQTRAGLSLLAEVRAPNTVAMLAKFARDARSQIRAHAYLLQGRVSPSLNDEIAARALLDPARKVRKVGVRLCTRGAFVSLEHIRAMIIQRRDRHAALAVCSRDQWDSVACIALIAELEMPSDDRDENLRKALYKWISNPVSSWTKPGVQHRNILSTPMAQSRLIELARDRHVELCARLRENGIEVS